MTGKFVGIRIDIESRATVDIKTGVYRYTEDPDFRVLCIAYSPLRRYDGGAVKMGKPRLLNMDHPTDVGHFKRIILDPSFQKHAFNAPFERIALGAWAGLPAGTYIDPENWRCSAIQANVAGVFGTLDEVARAVRSPIAKDSEGKRLIRLFSKPDRKTGKFHSPTKAPCWCGLDHRADFDKFGAYCKTDVLTEAAVSHLLPNLRADLQAEYEADQRINDRGFRHHKRLSEAAVAAVEAEKNRVMEELSVLTGLDNPNSVQQMKGWLEDQDYAMDSLDKAHREAALSDPFVPDHVREVLELKGQASLSSVAKHKAALDTRCADGRIRGSLRYYGAHTGREAGRGIQPQNLPRYEAPRADVKELLRWFRDDALPENVPAGAPLTAKGSVRGSIVPAKGYDFVTVDYSAIEARVLAGLAGEKWAEDEFRYGEGKIYEATAAEMFGLDKAQLVLDLKACGKCGKPDCASCGYRAKGKIGDLACGYNGGAGALVTMGAEAAGIDCGNYVELKAEWTALGSPGKFWEWEPDRHDYPELIRVRDRYRESRPMTVRFWKLCARAWDVASTGRGVRFGQNHMLSMIRDGKHNRLILPSGRSIWYRFARSHEDPERVNPDGSPRIDRRTFIGKSSGVGHMRTDTHGGKLTENVTQAVARDLLFDLIMRIEAKSAEGWPARLVLHVHDEVVLEVPSKHSEQVLADTLGMMNQTPEWGSTFAVKGEGAIMERYGK